MERGHEGAGDSDRVHVLCADVLFAEFVERKTNGRVRLGPGTLYTLLGKFQEEGLIRETEIQGRKRSYQITDAGRAAFQEELARLRTCVEDGEEESAWAEQEK